MAGLVKDAQTLIRHAARERRLAPIPAIHVLLSRRKTWMPATGGHDVEAVALFHDIRSCPSPPVRGQAPVGIQPWIPAFSAGHDAEGASRAFNQTRAFPIHFSNSPVFASYGKPMRQAPPPCILCGAGYAVVLLFVPSKYEGDGAPRGATIVL